MAVKGRNSEEVTVSSKTMYSGLGEFKVLCVNPTIKELSKFGIELKKEPEYVSENDEGVKRLRLDFWIKEIEKEFTTKISLWIEGKKFKASKNDKYQFINKYGKCAWGTPGEEKTSIPTDFSEYYKTEGFRKAFKGEENVHNFLIAYLNTVYDTKNDSYDECLLDSIEDMFKGNFKELQEIVKMFKDNTVRLLCGVDDNGYQVIYNKFFEKTCVTPNYKRWNKQLTDPYGEFRADFQSDYALQSYIPKPKELKASLSDDIASITSNEDDDDLL